MTIVSVVVPTFNRPDLLDRCIAALAVQELDPASYEVIVADDAASDATRQQVESWAERIAPELHYLPVTGMHGPAASRNRGWQAATGWIIAFTDDDCVPAPTWLRAGLAAFVDGVVGAWGRLEMPLPPIPTDFQLNASHLTEAEFVTANSFYRRDALRAVNGFDERFDIAWREDSDLHFTLLERGSCLVKADNAVVEHPLRNAKWGVSIKQQKKNVSNALLYKKHPALYRKRVQVIPPLRYYVATGSLLVAMAGAVGGLYVAALAGLLLWLALTMQFSLRRLHGTLHTPGHVTEMVVTSIVIPPIAIFWRLWGALKFRVVFF